MTEIEKNIGMTQGDILSQIQANKKEIDKKLEKLHEARLYVERLRKEADEKYKAFLEKTEGVKND